MLKGCLFTIREYILLELENQKIKPLEKDDVLDELDTEAWLTAFDDQKILTTTKNYLETCYAKSQS